MHRANRTPLGIGLIGLGRHGSRYARHLLNDVPEGRLTAVCRRHIHEGSGLPAGSTAACYADYRELIADSRVDAVVIVTPPALNREISLAVAAAGKPFLIEKPLAPTLDDARAIASAAAQCGCIAMTAQTLRFDSAILDLIAHQKEVGELRYVSVASRMEPSAGSASGFNGRGCLMEIGVHVLDLVRVLTADEVRQVSCEMDVVPPAGPEARLLGRLTTRRGIPCLIDVSRVSWGRVGRVELVGSEGQMAADWCGHRVTRISARHDSTDWSAGAEPTVVRTLRAFLQAIQAGVSPPVTMADGLRAVEIAEACYASAGQEGRIVFLEPN
jgi:predicted dehydrogenase